MSTISIRQMDGMVQGVNRDGQWGVYNGEYPICVGYLGYHAAREGAEAIEGSCTPEEIHYDYLKRERNQG